MSRCIIHIGMHKTGSTSIQNSLHAFDDDRFLYASLGNSPNHSLAIYSLFASHPGRHHLHKTSQRDAAAVRAYITAVETDLERAIAASRGRTLLISGEDIGVLEKMGLLRLRCYFRKHFDDVAVVGYVRPPAAFMASGFQQQLKNRSINRINLEQTYRNYHKSFSKFDEVFGRENVHLWKFDPGTFPDGCAVRDFCSHLDISLPMERIVRLNESLSRQAVALLYTYRKLGRKYGSETMRGRESQQLSALLADVDKREFRFSPDVVRPVLEKNRGDIEWMEARLGQSLDEHLGEHRLGDVRDESDLLQPDPESVSKLRSLLGERAPAGVTEDTPEQVALLVHMLRVERVPQGRAKQGGIKAANRPADVMPVKHGDSQMNITELIEYARQRPPNLLDEIPENIAQALVRSVFGHINDTLAGTEKGVVNYAGLGRFRVTSRVEHGRVLRPQIIFRRAEPGQGTKPDDAETEAG